MLTHRHSKCGIGTQRSAFSVLSGQRQLRQSANEDLRAVKFKAAIDNEHGQAIRVGINAFASRLLECTKSKDLPRGKQVHSHLIKDGYGKVTFLGNLLMQMYKCCGSLEDARRVFDGMQGQYNGYSWNIMISAYVQYGDLQEARSLFDEMPGRDTVSWTCMVGAYAQNGYLEKAKGLYDGMPIRNVVSWSAMLSAYAQNGHFEEARSVFQKMPCWNVISFNAMMSAYDQSRELHEVVRLFQKMPTRDVVSWTSILLAYANKGDLEEARRMFDRLPEWDVVSWTSMISAYALNGYLENARNLFDTMPQRNVVSWNAMIAAYVQNEHGEEALELFRVMDLEGVQHNRITFVSILDACADLAALVEGKAIHAEIVENGFPSDIVVETALVTMYGRCGELLVARGVFDKIRRRNVESWNAMITAYAQNGLGMEALELFGGIDLEGVLPNRITFMSILFACSHAGLPRDGWSYFVSMIGDYDIEADSDHYLCMVDLLGRAGMLEEAQELLKSMPSHPDVVAWTTLLAACRMHGDVRRGAAVVDRIFELDPENAPFVLVSNVCAQAGDHGGAAKVKKAMEGMGKSPGFSSIKIKGRVHEFLAGEQR